MYLLAALNQRRDGIVLRAGFVISAVALGLGTAACSGDAPKRPDTRATAGTAPVIIPGGPGEPARTAKPGERVGPSAPAAGPADVRFTQLMVPHHQQAIEMSTLARNRARSAPVRGLASRIIAAQKPEIAVLQSWQRAHATTAPGGAGGGHHAGMPGMATPQQLADLRKATGTGFDKMFLRLMITHHEGALAMATDVLKNGRDPFIRGLAKDVHASQSAEIKRMRPMLTG